MKKTFIVISILVVLAFTQLYACIKEYSVEGNHARNLPPIAVAGTDQVIYVPSDSALLDGSSSSDPDGQIIKWQWTKISGPSFDSIHTSSSTSTIVSKIVLGIYRFELMVTDDKGAEAKDTIELAVKEYYTDSIRLDSLRGGCCPCSFIITDLDPILSSATKFGVFLRYYFGTYIGSFYKLDTIPGHPNGDSLSSVSYWFRYSNGSMTIYYPKGVICDHDPSFHDLIIKWY